MIEIKTFAKSKSQGGKSSGSSSATTYVNTVVSEAEYASRAARAKRADNADMADYANKAGSATTAAYATKAGDIDAENAESLQTLLENYLRKDFVDKDEDGMEHWEKVENRTSFAEVVKFLKGIIASDVYSEGDVTSEGDMVCKETVKTKNLEVTGRARFFELVIDKVKSVGGAVLITPADGFDVNIVMRNGNDYTLYWQCDDGNGKRRDNMWKVGDQALCMSFNQAKVGSDGAHDVHNKYYWALVTEVSDSANPITFDSGKYHYIVISATDCDGTVSPESGDSIVMLGYRGTDDADRQSAIYISAYSSLDSGLTAPLIAQYRGINDFNLTSHRKSYFDAKGSKLVGDFETSSGQTMEGYVDGRVSEVKNGLDNKADKSDLDNKADKSDLDNKASKDDLITVSSSILQTARNISLEVSQKQVGRRNLLVGSAFRKQNDGAYVFTYGAGSIEKNTGIDGVNCAHFVNTYDGSNLSYTGVFWDGSQAGTAAQSVKIERGKKYTVSCWVKCDRTDASIVLETIYTDKQTGATRKTGPQTTNNGFNVSKANVWELFSCVIDTSKNNDGTENTQYDYIAVNFFCVHNLTDENGNGVTVNAYFCKPMLEEGDTYNGWTLSEQDYDYVGGNLLDNARTLAVGGNLCHTGESDIISEGYGYDSAVAHVDNGNGSSYKEILNWRTTSGGNVSFQKGADYLLSFLAKGNGDMICYMYCSANNTSHIYSENSQGYVTVDNCDGTSNFTLSSEWKRYWVHFRPLTSNPILTDILLRASIGANVYITQPKLEEGATMTEWTERKTDLIDKASLKAAGIEVTSDYVNLYGDQIKVSNTKGGTPYAMFSNGKLSANLIDADTITVNHLWAKDSSGNKIGHFGNIDGIGDAPKVGSAYCPLWVGGSTAANSFFRVSKENGMEVTKGTIGGFAINSGSLGTAVNKTTGSGGKEDIGYGQADKMSLTNDFIVFNGTNRQAIIGQWSTLGTPILMRLLDEQSDIATRYGAVISVKNKKGDAAAMVFGGGYTSGFALKTEVFTSSNKSISKDTNVALLNEWKTSYKLPDMQPYDDGHILMVKLIAGISATSKQNSEVYLDAGIYTDSNGVEHQSFFLYDGNNKDKTMRIDSIGDAMIFVFKKTIVNDTSDKGCWVQFKCPRTW